MEGTCGSGSRAKWWVGTPSRFLGMLCPRPTVLLVQPPTEWAQRKAEAMVRAPAVPSPQAVSMLSVVQPPEKAVVLSSAANGLGRRHGSRPAAGWWQMGVECAGGLAGRLSLSPVEWGLDPWSPWPGIWGVSASILLVEGTKRPRAQWERS